MSPSDSQLRFSLQLDPGTASFFGLPETLSLPAADGPLLEGDDTRTSLPRLAQALEAALDQDPDSISDTEVLGFLRRWPRYADLDRYLKMGSTTFAEKVAEALLEQDSGDPPALSALAGMAARDGDWSRAAALLQHVLERAPGYVPARLQHALAVAAAGDPEEAIQVLTSLSRRTRVQSLARFWLHELSQRPPSAIPSLVAGAFALPADRGSANDEDRGWDDLASISPENPEVLFARALRPQGDVTPEESESLLRSALTAWPGHVPAAAGLAEVMRAQGRPEAALEVLDAALAENPRDDQLLAAKGRALEQGGKGEEALAAYRAVFEQPLAHALPSPLLLAGSGILRLGSADEASALLHDACEARPGDPLPHHLLAKIDEAKNDKIAAEKRLRDGIKVCGPLPLLHYQLGDLLRRQGRRVEAEGMFKALRKRHPETHWGDQGLGHLLVETQPAKALEHYARAMEKNPTLVLAGYEYLRGVSALRSNDADTAQTHMQRAVAAEPDNARYWCDLGAVWFYQKNLSRAIECTQRALQLSPEHPGFLHNLAAYHQERFRGNPFRFAASGLAAWRYRRRVRSASQTQTEWRRDLWDSAQASTDTTAKEEPPPAL